MSSAATKAEAVAETALQLLFHADNLTVASIENILTEIKALAFNLQLEMDRIRRFKIDVKWKTRVISVPRAVTATKLLFRNLTTGLKDKIDDIAKPFEDFAAIARAELATSGFIDPIGGQQESKIVSAFTKLEDFITSLNNLVGDVSKALQQAANFVDLFDQLLQEVEHLETFFLQQGNPRKRSHDLSVIRVGRKDGSMHLS
jgi:hypothetical protein